MMLSHGAKFRDIPSSNFRSDGWFGCNFGGKHQEKHVSSHSRPSIFVTPKKCQETMLLVPALQKTTRFRPTKEVVIFVSTKNVSKKQTQLPFNFLRMFLFRQIELIFVGRFFVEDWNVRIGDFNSPIATANRTLDWFKSSVYL